MSQPLEFENLSYNSPGGSVFGKTSTDKVGFYGVAPVALPQTTSTNLVSTTAGINVSTNSVTVTTWGWATQVEANNAIAAVSSMQSAMKSLGLIAGGVDPKITRTGETFEMADYGSSDGARFGNTATELIAFYGATPAVRITTVTADISTATTVSASTNGVATTPWGWSTSSEFAMFNSAISTMQLQMKQLGLVA